MTSSPESASTLLVTVVRPKQCLFNDESRESIPSRSIEIEREYMQQQAPV